MDDFKALGRKASRGGFLPKTILKKNLKSHFFSTHCQQKSKIYFQTYAQKVIVE